MKTNNEWVTKQIERLASFGKSQQGINRLVFSEADKNAKEYIIELMQEAGMEIKVDAIGNVIGRRGGKDNNAPAVVTGSHLDTVPQGGKYDGVVGVIGGLAALINLQDKELTHPLELIVFAGEESSRFGIANMGSKAIAGLININTWAKLRDQDGKSFTEHMYSNNLNINNIAAAKRVKEEIKAFIELHIEQGDLLEKNGTKIGIVNTIAAPTRLKITVEGMAAHSGCTSIENRQDALVSASMIVIAINEIAREQSRYGTVATVGALKVYPGAINVVPGLVDMWVDIRGINHESIIECLQEIKDAISTIADGDNTSISIKMLSSDKPVHMDRDMIDALVNVCIEQNISFQQINSRAGHDAMIMSRLAPAGMIFIPSQGGISHNPAEYTTIEDIMTGIDVLTKVIYNLAK